MSKISEKTVLSNFLWRFFERCGSQGVSLIVSIVLARILEPEAYGIVAIVVSVTTILQVFVDSGLGNALIQKKHADDTDFSTVFYFNIVVCILLYVFLFVGAPIIAAFFDMPELTRVIRALGLTVIVSGVKNVLQAFVSRNMLFKRFFFSTLIGTSIAAIVGIVMASLGFRVWALIAQQLTSVLVDTVVLWFTVKWRPKLLFSFKRLKELFSFGVKILISRLVSALSEEIRTLTIGKFYDSNMLAYYNKGMQFPAVIETNLVVSIDSVLFPAMSAEQDDKKKVKAIARRSVKMSSYLMFPLMMGLAASATSFIIVVFTEKWLPSVPYLMVFCITYSLYPIITASWNSMKSIGKGGTYLFLEMFRIFVGLSMLLITVRKGTFAIAIGFLIATIISLIPIFICNKKFIDYTILEQLKDIFPSFVMSLVMGVAVWACGKYIVVSPILLLAIQVVIGVMIYGVISLVLKNENFTYILSRIKQIIHRKKNDDL